MCRRKRAATPQPERCRKTLTVREYLALSRWGRLIQHDCGHGGTLQYRLYRHPIIMFGVGLPSSDIAWRTIASPEVVRCQRQNPDSATHPHAIHHANSGNLARRGIGEQLRRAQVLTFFSRLPRCLVGLEACATAHYWGRELRALGHEVRLMPAQYVKAYVKRNKNDAADAAAICEAVMRPTMRFVPVKTADQQAAVLLHRGRERLVRQRTGLVNALRGHLAEFGVIAPQGLRNVGKLIAIVRDEGDGRLPDLARQVLAVLAAQIEQLEAAVAALEKQLIAWHKSNSVSQRLASVPGIGPIIATAIAATVTEPSGFRSGREFAAWLGLVPRQNSTGGKNRLGRTRRNTD